MRREGSEKKLVQRVDRGSWLHAIRARHVDGNGALAMESTDGVSECRDCTHPPPPPNVLSMGGGFPFLDLHADASSMLTMSEERKKKRGKRKAEEECGRGVGSSLNRHRHRPRAKGAFSHTNFQSACKRHCFVTVRTI